MKAVTIGGAMVDSIALIDDARIERMTMRNAESSFLLLEEGRKTEALEISQHCGGGAINAAVSMARLGLDVATVVKLGQDQRAEILLRKLADERVSTRWVMREAGLATGAAVMIASHERDAAIFTFRGANTLLCADDLKPDMFGADLVYISGLSNESADCFPDIVAHARQTGALVATNPGIRQLTSRSSSFHAALSGIDVLAVNRNEADALVPQLVGQFGEGGPTPDLEGSADVCPELILRGLRSGGHEMSLSRFVSALCGCGVGQVVVTNGGDGAYVGDRTQLSHCPALPTRIAGTAGAGDAFASTFAAWFASKGDAVIALQAGVLNSASVIGHADTQSGLLNARELDGRLVEAADQLAVRSWSLESDLP
jgi:ribokinase